MDKYEKLKSEIKRQVAFMRKLADATECDNKHDSPVRQFFVGRVACLREQASNFEDIMKELETNQ